MHDRHKAFKKPGTTHLPPKEKDLRFLLLSIGIGLLACVIFGLALLLLNKQGRI
jgi:hypothetical protein